MSGAEHSPSVVLHGHFYQPPREDPWLETVERQPSAHPFHDWNERVEQECYRAVAAARLPGRDGRIRSILNTLRHISFDFGPTLLEWLETHARRTYEAVLEADAESRRRLGFGNALAQAYHHAILPLASRREKALEIRWGILDFRRRFRRDPQGMWLPETALDRETLEVLAEEGIAFTVVAPHQVHPLPSGGMPGLVRLAGGRTIVLFPYHGPLSAGVAFGPLVEDAEAWVRAVLEAVEEGAWEEGTGAGAPQPGTTPGAEPGGGGRRSRLPAWEGGSGAGAAEADSSGSSGGWAAPWPASMDGRATRPLPRALVAMAVDGETFGHHRRFGEMALAALLEKLRESGKVRVENFAGFLARHPPMEEVELVEPSSWSCPHGVERWRGNCGCRLDLSYPPRQEWRAPLRKALEALAQGLHDIYNREAPRLMEDPWEALAGYGAVASQGPEATRAYVRARAGRRLEQAEETRAAELLEMERNALRFFTSCGWFFDRLEGIEPLQILGYAARAVELAGPEGARLEAGFLEILAQARTQETPARDGKSLYLAEVKPGFAVPLRIAAGAAAVHFVAGKGSSGGDQLPRAGHIQGEAQLAGAPEPVPPADPPGFATQVGPGPQVQVRHRRTGREWVGRFDTREPTPADLRVEVTLDGVGGPQMFRLSDLPEPYRETAIRLARRSLAEAWAPEERRLLDLEEAGGLRAALGRRLLEAIQALPASLAGIDPMAHHPPLLRVEGLARLHTLLDFPIPFDAQTEFYRILERLNPPHRSLLAPLLEPLGFEPPA